MLDPSLRAALHGWLYETALPFWSEAGLDRRFGGPVEALTLAGEDAGLSFKRTRVAARQVFAFSLGERAGVAGAGAAADHCYAFLVSRCWLGADAGWARRVSREGALLDATPDLYDFAFALFALAWRAKARGEAGPIALAHQTLDFLEARFAHPDGGFHAALPGEGPRQQNPHMHLLEAALALYEASGEARFRTLADDLAALARRHFVRLPEGALLEFFTQDWAPAPGAVGRRVEPGHQFEWAWILAEHQRLTGADHGEAAGALVAMAERFGVDRGAGATFNAIDIEGAVVDAGSRTWPNTERMKGWIGLHALAGAEVAEQAQAAVAQSARLLLDRYFAPAPRGAWIDVFDAAGHPQSKEIPASTLYHVALAFHCALEWSPTASPR